MAFDQSPPEVIAEAMAEEMGREPRYRDVGAEGAEGAANAAARIAELI